MKQGKCCAGAQGAPELSPADMPAHGHEAHKAAGEADAAGMATGAHMGPPPGAAFDADGRLPAAPGGGPAGEPVGDAAAAADAPGDLIGVPP